MGGATLFILKKKSGNDEKSQMSSGGGSGFIIPSGFGTSEITNPSSSSTPNIIINESSYNPPTDTKKETIAKKSADGKTLTIPAGSYTIGGEGKVYNIQQDLVLPISKKIDKAYIENKFQTKPIWSLF